MRYFLRAEGRVSTVEVAPFIVLEGIDGSGTTTQAELLGRWTSERGKEALITREPSSGPVGTLIRRALRGELTEVEALAMGFDWKTFALLFSADRVDHLSREIVPALSQGRTVICDRYDLSSLIYQSATSPEGNDALPWLRELNARARRPDMTIILQVPAEEAETRRRARAESPELFEEVELQGRLARFYAEAGRFAPKDRIEMIEANRSIEDVFSSIIECLLKLPEFARIYTPSR